MAEKTLRKVFNYEDKNIPYGFLKLNKRPSFYSIVDIFKGCRSSMILVDTNGKFIKEALTDLNELDPYGKTLIAGLVDKATLLRIKDSGIKNGFYRSTTEKISVGLIILNKTDIYGVLDVNHIYKLADNKAGKEIFAMINHIIWSKTEEEYFGTLNKVEDIRLSVIAPDLACAIKPDLALTYEYASESLAIKAKNLIVTRPSSTLYESAFVLDNLVTRMFGELHNMYFEVFPNSYYPFEFAKDCFSHQTFANNKVASLVGKEVFVNGKTYDVLEKDTISDEVYVYLNEYDNYQPDFEPIANRYNQFTKELEVSVVVKTIKADGSYRLSNRYEIIDRTNKQIEEGLSKMEKLLDESQIKKIDSVRKERILGNKVKMFNELVLNKEFGVASLNQKKSPISTINVNESDLYVPNELIGKLLTKNGFNYLATKQNRLEEAKQWLADNKVEAFLIEE